MTNLIITAYCACKLCCGPTAPNLTAAGTVPKQGITVAAPRRFPLNSSIFITIAGTAIVNKQYRIEDRLADRFDNRIDIYFHSHKMAKQFGKKKGYVWVKPTNQRAN